MKKLLFFEIVVKMVNDKSLCSLDISYYFHHQMPQIIYSNIHNAYYAVHNEINLKNSFTTLAISNNLTAHGTL